MTSMADGCINPREVYGSGQLNYKQIMTPLHNRMMQFFVYNQHEEFVHVNHPCKLNIILEYTKQMLKLLPTNHRERDETRWT